MRIFILIAFSLFIQNCASKTTAPEATPVEKSYTEQTVEYKVDGITHKGYLAAPKSEGKKPAVIVVHEWWGHNDYARQRADQLAEQGYVAFALDMYGEGKTASHPKDAGEFAGAVMKNQALMIKKFQAAMDSVKARPDVDSSKIAAIGYCFGGAVVISMAKLNMPLKGVVSVHGMLNTPVKAKAGKNKPKVLALNGADDTFITQKNIDDFKSEMKSAKIDNEFVNYPNAKHAFSNPAATENGKKFNLPLEYNPEVDTASWNKSLEFLTSVFK